MTNNSDGLSLKWSLIFSLLIHGLAFLVFRTTIEHKKVVYYSSIPVQLYKVEIPEPKKKNKARAIRKNPEKKKEKKVSIKKTSPKKAQKKKIAPPKKAEQKKTVQSNVMSIDLKNFPFPWYLNAIEQKIRENWIFPADLDRLAGKKAVVYFRIMRGGELNSVRVESSSEDSTLDLSGLRAVKGSAPFPPLPSAFDEEYLNVHYHFKIQ